MTYMNVLLSVGFSIRPARASSILHSDWRTIRHLLSFLEVLFFLGRFFPYLEIMSNLIVITQMIIIDKHAPLLTIYVFLIIT